MTLEQKTMSSFTYDEIENDVHGSGMDKISLIIVLICCLLIFTVILASIVNWIRRKRSRRLQEEHAVEMAKTGIEDDIEMDIKTEEELQAGKIKNTKNIKYSPHEDTSAKTEKDSANIDKFSDRSNSISTSRQLFVNKQINSVSKSNHKQILIDFVNQTSPNFDESDINHVDVSFKGGEGDRSMVNYERRIGNLPLNLGGRNIIEKTLHKSLNNSKNDEEEDDNSKLSEDYDEEENKDEVMRHHEKMSKNLYDYAGLEYNNDMINHDDIFPLDNHNGLDDNPYMTADFVNAIEDYDNDDFGYSKDKKEKNEYLEKTERKDSFGKEKNSKDDENRDKVVEN